MTVFGLPHLSEDAVAAFADGVLSGTAASRAAKHCAECPECAAAVRIQRETTFMLRTASNPSMPAGLLDRLAGLPMSTPLPPPNSGLPTTIGADGVPVFVAHNPPRARHVDPRPDGDRSHDDDRARKNDRPDDDRARKNDRPGKQERVATPHRRVTLPVGIIASAAAVVAAGTIGGTGSPQPVEPQPASIRHIAGQTGPDSQAVSGTLADIQVVNAARIQGDPVDQPLPARRVLATSPRFDRP